MVFLCIISVVMSGVAVWLTLREAAGAVKGKRAGKTAPRKMTVAERQRQAVLRREHENFMNYDGTPQAPIDPDRILGE